MTVDDDETVVRIVEKEGLPDPSKVRLALIIELDARTYSGVNEKVVPEAASIDEFFQELDVLWRKCCADCLDSCVRPQPGERGGINAIAC